MALICRRTILATLGAIAASSLLPFTEGRAEASVVESGTDDFPIKTSDTNLVPRKFRKREVAFATTDEPGTIIVDPTARYLYLVLDESRALRYGIGVGRQGFEWSGDAKVKRKAKWPRWTPPQEMVERDPYAAKWADGMPGGPTNPLGARALYLFQGDIDTLYRIHGTYQPQSIGKAVSSGCIRMINADVADLYERVRIGSAVKVLTPSQSHLASREKTGRKKRYLFEIFR